MSRRAVTIVAALAAACVPGFAFADLNNPYYLRAHESYLAGDYSRACPDLMTYRQQDRAFLERPENLLTRQQIEEVARFCDRRQAAAACPPGYVCQSSGPVAGGPPPNR